MGISHYLKEIARGKEGARSLAAAQAQDLMSQVLDRDVSEAERGAFAIAMRIKGESIEELTGFTAAVTERSLAFDASALPVLLPSYNGARKLPNLTPLLALLLAQEGVPVLVHGPERDPGRITTHELFSALGLPIARDVEDVHAAWRRHEPVFMPIGTLCPSLQALLDLRWTLGLRNPAHTVAKLLTPRATPCLRVVNYTHPEYGQAHTHFLQASRAHAMLLRGTEGEPVADPRRLPKLELFLDGVIRPDLGRSPQDGVLTGLPLLPRCDVASTGLYIQAAVSGEQPVPAALIEQVDALVKARSALQKLLDTAHERSA